MIKVWDLPTRVFHWMLVIAMILCVYTSYNFSDFYNLGFLGSYSAMAVHQYAGTMILGLLIFRLIWGIIGSKTSLFSDFIKGPKHIISYLKESKTPTEGHNPLGALMVVALIVVLLIQVVTGLFLEDNTYLFSNAPLAGLIKGDLRSDFLSLHGNGRLVLLWLIGIHVFTVFVYLFVKKQNLIRTMVTGKRAKADAHTPEAPSLKSDRSLLGIILLIAVVVLTYYVLFTVLG